MNSKSLMIGDWVMNPNDGKKYRVHTITACEQTRLSNPYNLTDLEYGLGEPIPLTAEILEKNGFTKDENCGYCLWLDKHLIAVNLDTYNLAIDSILIADEVQIADNYIHIPALPIHFVHELQNALRLCELDELADNFKI